MKSKNQNKDPLPRATEYSAKWHMDIGFGPTTAIGGIKYCLLLVDSHSRLKLTYGLKNLNSSLISALKRFIIDAQAPIGEIRTDFDTKLIHGDVRTFLDSSKIKILASPPYRQHQNGLVERHWQTLVSMSRNWLRASLLPSTYWFFAIKRAAEVLNMYPTQLKDGTVTTPFETVYNEKPDLRTLIPLFSTAYIKKVRDRGLHRNKWYTQSLRCIVVGTCPDSDSLLFYHPPSKQTLSCADGYKFDTFLPSGPTFKLRYDGTFNLNSVGPTSHYHTPHLHEENEEVFVNINDSVEPARIISVPLSDDDPNDNRYSVQLHSDDSIHTFNAESILKTHPSQAPDTDPDASPTTPIHWIKPDTKCVVF